MIADDTYILILFYHAADYIEITMKSEGSQININSLRNAIGAEMIECLPFAHAISGCDTISSIFGQGKLKHCKLFEKSRELREKVSNIWRR